MSGNCPPERPNRVRGRKIARLPDTELEVDQVSMDNEQVIRMVESNASAMLSTGQRRPAASEVSVPIEQSA